MRQSVNIAQHSQRASLSSALAIIKITWGCSSSSLSGEEGRVRLPMSPVRAGDCEVRVASNLLMYKGK